MDRKRFELLFATAMLAIGLAILFVWIPRDIDSGMIETFRRQTFIGDAFIPTLAGWAIVICAGLQMLALLLSTPRSGATFRDLPLTRGDLALQLVFLSIIAAALLAMFWGGAALATLFSDSSYRNLRGSFPYKYAGFFLGGSLMLAGLITAIEGHLRPVRLAFAIGATLFLIVLFDVPFDGILLPPNGDW